MRIGVDAGALGVTDERLKVGVYRVIVNVLRELSHLDTKNKYFLYSFDPIDGGVMSELGSNMDNKVLWPAKGWFTFRLPLELKLHPVDVFLGLSQAIPRSKSYNIGLVHDLGFLHFPHEYPESFLRLKQQTQRLVYHSDKILTVSKTVKADIMKTYGKSSDKILVAYDGVDPHFTRSSDTFVTRNPYFLFVGSLKAGKNVPTILKAFSRFIADQNTPFDLLLVGGDFWKDQRIEKNVSKYHLSKQVRLLGYVPDLELAEYYRGAVAFVSPSLHEGFCLPAVEAMASGCPVIGSTSGAMPEIVGDAGILTDPGDINGLVRAMNILTHDAKKRRELIKKGISRAKRFSWKVFAKTLYSIIRSVHET